LPKIEAALGEERQPAPSRARRRRALAVRRSRAILTTLLADPDDSAAASAAFSAGTVGGAEMVQPMLDAAAKRAGMVRTT